MYEKTTETVVKGQRDKRSGGQIKEQQPQQGPSTTLEGLLLNNLSTPERLTRSCNTVEPTGVAGAIW